MDWKKGEKEKITRCMKDRILSCLGGGGNHKGNIYLCFSVSISSFHVRGEGDKKHIPWWKDTWGHSFPFPHIACVGEWQVTAVAGLARKIKPPGSYHLPLSIKLLNKLLIKFSFSEWFFYSNSNICLFWFIPKLVLVELEIVDHLAFDWLELMVGLAV